MYEGGQYHPELKEKKPDYHPEMFEQLNRTRGVNLLRNEGVNMKRNRGVRMVRNLHIDELNLRDTLFKKSRFYNATNPDPDGEIMATDNPSYSVFVRLDTLVHVSVYGYISLRDYRKRFPSQVLNIHDFVLKFDSDRYTKWIPDKIEVMLSDYSHSPDTPIQWPANWPDLNSPDTRKQDGYVTSIFLDKKYFNQLAKLIKKRREKQAFEINGRKYFIGYRFPIPGQY